MLEKAMKHKIAFENYSLLVGEKHSYDWYDWCVFVSGDKQAVEKIREVVYYLHPTFPDPERLITEKENRFALFSSGWGVFFIDIEVTLWTGETESLEHKLVLSKDNWPRQELTESAKDHKIKNVYEALFDPRSRWRKFETIVKKANLPNKEVQKILNILQEQNYVRKAYYKSIDNKELWGATSVVGTSPRL